jgi:hypothetical protein
MHHRTKSSKKLQKLREEPQTDMGMPSGGPLRNMICKLTISNNASGSSKSRGIGLGGITPVYYLVGDERRAVRKFILENLKLIQDYMEEEQQNVLAEKLDETIYWLLEQEYEIMKYNGEI